jgi:hypothetical protein
MRRRGRPRPLRTPLRCEPLEDRTLLSTFDVVNGQGSYVASAGVANDLTIAQVGAALLIQDTAETISLTAAAKQAGCSGDSTNAIQCPTGAITSLAVDTADGPDQVTVLPQGLSVGVAVGGQSGAVGLTIDDSADATPRAFALDGGSVTATGLATVGFAPGTLNALTVNGGGGGNLFTVTITNPSAGYTTTLNCGTGQNVVNVQATTGPLNVVGQGGNDLVTVGYQGPGVGGTLAGIQGSVSIGNSGPYTQLTVDDSGDPTPRQGTISSSQINGQNPDSALDNVLFNSSGATPLASPLLPGTINFAPDSLGSLTVEGGSGGNLIGVAGTGSGYTTLDSGTGQDIVLVQATTGPLVLDGQDGRDQVVLGQWAAFPNALEGFSPPGSTLAGITGQVTIRNDHSLTDVTVDDGGDFTPVAYSVYATQVNSTVAAPIDFLPGEVNSLTVRAGSGGNSFRVADTPAGAVTTLDTGFFDQVNVLRTSGSLKINDASGTAQVALGPDAANVEHAISRGTLSLTSDTDGTLAAATDEDSYTLNVPQDQPGYLQVTLTPGNGSSFDGRVALLNSDSFTVFEGTGVGGGGLLATSDEQAPDNPNPSLSQYLLPGQYFVQVSAAQSGGAAPGDYTLSLQFTPDASDPYDPNNLPRPAVDADPQAIVSADFNNDGVIDLATVSPGAAGGTGTVSVLLGVGDGTFEKEKSFPVFAGDHPDRLLALDYNGDGRIDLATWDHKSGMDGSVDILRGLGDGTFDAESILHLPAQGLADDPRFAPLFDDPPALFVTGDFNEDGDPNSGAALVPLPDGTFADYLEVAVSVAQAANGLIQSPPLTDLVGGPVPGSSFAANGFATSADRNFSNPPRSTPIVADLNGAGVPDVLEVNRKGAILLRLGVAGQPGTFEPPQTVNDPSSDPAREIALVSSDPAHPQVAAITELSSRLLVYTGTVDPVTKAIRWQKPYEAVLGTGFLAARVAAGDLDGDGRNDLVVANQLLGTLAIFLNQGDGTFRRAADLKAGITTSDILLSDPQHTGHANILVTDEASGDVSVFVNEALPQPGTVAFQDELRYRAGVPAAGYGVDLAITSQIANGVIDGNTGGNSPGLLPTIAMDLGLPSLTPAQFSGLVGFLTGLQLPLYPPGPYPQGFPDGELFPPLYFGFSLLQTGTGVVADFNGDGVPDLVVTNRGTNTLTYLQGKPGGGGSFIDPQASQTFATGDEPDAVVAGDFEGDGIIDLAVLNDGDNTVWIYKGDGHGGFTHTYTYDAGVTPTGLTVADVNGDGIPDLLIGNAFGDVLELLSNGNGSFRPPDDRSSLFVTNLGGRSEALVGSPAAGNVTVQAQAAADVGFSTLAKLAPATTGTALFPGDVRWLPLERGSAAYPDAVVLDAGSNRILVYRVTGVAADGTPTFAAPESFAVGTDPVNVTMEDLKGGGVPDLVVANQGSNDVSVLFGAYGPDGFWTATEGPRLQSGGSGPVGVTLRDNGPQKPPDLVVTNGDSGTMTLLPGVGNGFFNDQAPQTLVNLGTPVVAAPEFTGPGLGVVPTAGGQLVQFNLNTGAAPTVFTPPAGDGVTAVQAMTDGNLVVAERGGGVEELGLNADGNAFEPVVAFTPLTGIPSDPSALQILGNGDEVLATDAGGDRIFVFVPAGPSASPSSIALGLPPVAPPQDTVTDVVAAGGGPRLALVVTLETGLLPPNEAAPVGEGGAAAIVREVPDAEVTGPGLGADPAGDEDQEAPQSPDPSDTSPLPPRIEAILHQVNLYEQAAEEVVPAGISRLTLPSAVAAPGEILADGWRAVGEGLLPVAEILGVHIGLIARAPGLPLPDGGARATGVGGTKVGMAAESSEQPCPPVAEVVASAPAPAEVPPVLSIARPAAGWWTPFGLPDWERAILVALAAGGAALWAEQRSHPPQDDAGPRAHRNG